MKYLFISFLLIGVYITTFAQQKPNLFETLKMALDTLPKKHTLVYTYTSWCGGVKESLPKLLPIIEQYKEKINFIVLADTTNNTYLNSFVTVKPVTYIPINPFYPKRFLSRKEGRMAGYNFNSVFNAKETSFGSSTLFLLGCDHELIKSFFIYNREDDLQNTLKELKNSCE